MKKTVTANISGQFFHIDEDAYERLLHYLETIRGFFRQEQGGEEIMQDIEARIAEMLKESTSERKQVVTLADVEQVIAVMGRPEDYLDGTESYQEAYTGSTTNIKRRIYRNPDDRLLGGVCGGLGAYFDVDPLWIRLALVFMLFIFGFGPLIYIILWILIPEAKTPSEKLAMRGEPINVDNISKAVRDEFNNVGERVKEETASFRKKDAAGKVRNGLHDLLSVLGDIAGRLVKVLVRLTGLLLLAFGLLFLIVIILGLVSDNVSLQVHDGEILWISVKDILTHLLPVGFSLPVVYSGLALLLLIPVVGMLLAGVRLLFNIRRRVPYLGLTLGVLWIVGLTLVIWSGIATLREFNKPSVITQRTQLHLESDTIVLSMNPDGNPRWENLFSKHNGRVVAGLKEDSLYIGHMEIDIRKGEPGIIVLEQKNEARGKTSALAELNASEIRVPYHLERNQLIIPKGYYTAAGGKFRAQETELILHLPEGKHVFLAEGTGRFLNDVDNVCKMGDRQMEGRLWTMTSTGLVSADCLPDTAKAILSMAADSAGRNQ